MNKELKKLYYQCKSRGYNESAEQFEKDLARIVIKELRGDDLGKVSGGINGRKAIAGALSAILGLIPSVTSAAGVEPGLKAPSTVKASRVSRIRPRRTSPTSPVAVASNKSSNQLAKIVFGGGGAVGIVGTGIAGLAYLTNLLASSKQEEEQADEESATTQTPTQDTTTETSTVNDDKNFHEKEEEEKDDPSPAPDPTADNDDTEEGNHPSEFGEKEQTLDWTTAPSWVQFLENHLVNAFYNRIESSIETFEGPINNGVLYNMYNRLQSYANTKYNVYSRVYEFSYPYCMLDFMAEFMDLLAQNEYTCELNNVCECGNSIKNALGESSNLVDSSYFNDVDKFTSKQLLNFIRACHFIKTSTPLPGEEGPYATSHNDQYFDVDIVGSDWFNYIDGSINKIFVKLNQYAEKQKQDLECKPFDFSDEEDLIDLDQNNDGPSALEEEGSQSVDTTNTAENDTPALTAPAEQQKIEQAPQPAESEEPQSITTETNDEAPTE